MEGLCYMWSGALQEDSSGQRVHNHDRDRPILLLRLFVDADQVETDGESI